jgi:hypothetical protein
MNTTDKTEREKELESCIEVVNRHLKRLSESTARTSKELEEERALYQSELAQLREQKQGNYPKKGEVGFMVFTDSDISAPTLWDNSEEQQFAFRFGNWHTTYEEAEQYREKLLTFGKLFFSLTPQQLDKIAVQVKVAEMARESWGGEDSYRKHGWLPYRNDRDQVFGYWTLQDYGVPRFKDDLSLQAAFDSLSKDERDLFFTNRLCFPLRERD